MIFKPFDGGAGVVVMINSNHPDFMNEVVSAVGHTYGWDGYEAHDILPVPEEMLNEYTGRFYYNAALLAFRAALEESPNEETLSENYLNGYAFPDETEPLFRLFAI